MYLRLKNSKAIVEHAADTHTHTKEKEWKQNTRKGEIFGLHFIHLFYFLSRQKTRILEVRHTPKPRQAERESETLLKNSMVAQEYREAIFCTEHKQKEAPPHAQEQDGTPYHDNRRRLLLTAFKAFSAYFFFL